MAQPNINRDKVNRGGPHMVTVDPKVDYEVQYWTRAWSVTRTELSTAVRAVGHDAADVAAFLNKPWPVRQDRRWPTPSYQSRSA